MSLVKIKIKKVIQQSENFTRFEGEYYGGHSFLSPYGFEAIAKGYRYQYTEGNIIVYDNSMITITKWGEGTEEAMINLAETLKLK